MDGDGIVGQLDIFLLHRLRLWRSEIATAKKR